MIDVDALIGRPFEHGKVDCYTVWMDLYFRDLGIKLPNLARPNDWWLHGMDFYMEHPPKNGFEFIDENEPVNLYDVFLIAVPDRRQSKESTPANHCAIYIGDGKIIHHPFGKQSIVAEYMGSLKRFTVARVRHKTVDMPEVVQRETIDLLDHLPAHKRYLKEIYDAKTS